MVVRHERGATCTEVVEQRENVVRASTETVLTNVTHVWRRERAAVAAHVWRYTSIPSSRDCRQLVAP